MEFVISADQFLMYLLDYIPDDVEFVNEAFQYNQEKIIQEAIEAGYKMIYIHPAVEKEEITNDITKVCIVDAHSISFKHRQFFKGKASNNFIFHREGDKPAFFSSREVSFMKNGEHHRENNKPSHFHPIEIAWNVNGKWHRDDGGHTIINRHRGIYFHKNHDCWKRIINDGEEMPVGYKNGYMEWTKTSK